MTIKELKKAINVIINGGKLPTSEDVKVKEATEGDQQQHMPVTTSTNPTDLRFLRQKPRTHLKQTRSNTPGAAPPIITEEPAVRRSRRLNPDTAAPRPTGEPISAHILHHKPNIITQAVIDMLTVNVYYGANTACWTPNKYLQFDPTIIGTNPIDIEHFCAPVVHPTMKKTITSYRKLAKKDEELKETLTTGFGKKWESFTRGQNTGTPGMDAIRVMNLEQIKNNPVDRVVTYARVVVDFRPHKEDPNRVRITAGGNLIAYPDKLTTRTSDFTVSKILWNSVLSTDDARYATLDIANLYFGIPLDRYEYTKIPLSIFSQIVRAAARRLDTMIPGAEAKCVHRLEILMEHHEIVDKVQRLLHKVQSEAELKVGLEALC